MKPMYKPPLSFYPGPSKVYPEIIEHLQDGYQSGILSANHRSQPFMDLMEDCIKVLKDKLAIPVNYEVHFCTAATECWEIIAQAYPNKPSYHIFNGSFGEKWWSYRHSLHSHASRFEWSPQRMLPYKRLQPPFSSGLICLTQNETSNATQVSNKQIQKIKKRFPKSLLCIDATSSMAGVELDWLSGDIWYASVQKCFGLPAGLAVMVCSPKSLEWAKQEGQKSHYNSLLNIHVQQQKRQTTHTPNVLNIYLLKCLMEQVPPIRKTSRHLKKRARYLISSLEKKGYKPLIHEPRLQSDTVVAIKATPEKVADIKKKAIAQGIILGNGYGQWKSTSLRIANFPAITNEEVEQLLGANIF